MQTINWLEFWYAALHSQLGVVLAVSDPEHVRAKLYQARAKSGDRALEGLQLRISPILPQEEVWILHSQKKEASDGT